MADPYLQPALAIPPGVTSQFPTTYSDDQKYYYVCVVLTAVVPGVLLLLRLYTKQRIIHKIDAIDCAVTPPVICSTVANDYIDVVVASFVSCFRDNYLSTKLLIQCSSPCSSLYSVSGV